MGSRKDPGPENQKQFREELSARQLAHTRVVSMGRAIGPWASLSFPSGGWIVSLGRSELLPAAKDLQISPLPPRK